MSALGASRSRAKDAIARTILGAIIVVYVCLAVVWVVRTPIFAPPDEMAHADYMFTFFDAGGFYRTEAGSVANDVLPETKYLDEMSGYRRIHYNEFGRVPNGYGTANYFRHLAAAAPAATGSARPSGSVMPYVAYAYPATYYLVIAEFARLLTFANPRAAVAAFFIARGFGVLLGVGTILLAFSAFRNLRFGNSLSLVSVAGIAFLPLFSWVSAYIQPDNLIVFLVTLATWSVYRKSTSFGWLSFAVCGLCLVKVHYGIALWLPSLLYALGTRRRHSSALSRIFLLGVGPLVAVLVSFHLTPVENGLRYVVGTVKDVDPAGLGVAGFARSLEASLASVYFGGAVFTNYWFGYGTHGFYLSKPQSLQVAYVASFVTVSVLFACILLFISRFYRIVRVGFHGGARVAFRLAASGYAVNVYLSYTALLLAASTIDKIPLSLEARYWLPLLVPTTIILVRELPRAVPRRFRSRAALLVAGVILLFAAPLDAMTPWVIQRDYYSAPTGTPKFNFGGLVINGSGDAESFHSRESHARSRDLVKMRGFALDIVSGLPADRVTILSDGRFVASARRIRWDVDPAAQWHDDVLESAGFEADVPAKTFGAGHHDISVVVRRGGEMARPLEHHVELFVSS